MPSTPPPEADGPRILVSGWAGAGNVGDELLTRAIVDRLRDLGARPVVASQDPEETAARHGVRAVPWGPRGLRERDIDAVCVGPGGILQDSSSLWSLPGHLAAALFARRRGLPVAAIGVGAESLRRRSSGWLLRRALGGRPIVTRDEESSAALRAAGLDAVTGADLVFGLDLGALGTPDRDHVDEIVVSIGGGVRPGLVAPASRRIEAPPVAEIAAALDRLAESLGARVVLTRFRGHRDAEAAEAVRERLSADSEVLPADVDAHVRRTLGARLVVSSRYHPLVLAARGAVPALAVSTQAKVQSLVAQIDRASVVQYEGWDAVGRRPSPQAGARHSRVPDGVTKAHEALSQLVAAAGAPRVHPPGG